MKKLRNTTGGSRPVPNRDSKRIERALTRQALANEPREMQSEITPVESQQAGEREAEAVRRAEETARGVAARTAVKNTWTCGPTSARELRGKQ